MKELPLESGQKKVRITRAISSEILDPEDKVAAQLKCHTESWQGKKDTQEDRYIQAVRVGKLGTVFGLFDGHGGVHAAEYAGKHLPRNMQRCYQQREGGKRDGVDPKRLVAAMEEAFPLTDRELLQLARRKARSPSPLSHPPACTQSHACARACVHTQPSTHRPPLGRSAAISADLPHAGLHRRHDGSDGAHLGRRDRPAHTLRFARGRLPRRALPRRQRRAAHPRPSARPAR